MAEQQQRQFPEAVGPAPMPAAPAQPAQAAPAAQAPGATVPTHGYGHGVFDRIAQGMSDATTFALPAVAMRREFREFDDALDDQSGLARASMIDEPAQPSSDAAPTMSPPQHAQRADVGDDVLRSDLASLEQLKQAPDSAAQPEFRTAEDERPIGDEEAQDEAEAEAETGAGGPDARLAASGDEPAVSGDERAMPGYDTVVAPSSDTSGS
jgi:hypothetical protein